MEAMIQILKAASDRNRIRILMMLQQKTMCVCELASVLGIAQPSVSRHLKKMKDAGLIDCRKDGFWTVYFVNPTGKFAESITKGIQKQLNGDPVVQSDLQLAERTDKTEVCCSMEKTKKK